MKYSWPPHSLDITLLLFFLRGTPHYKINQEPPTTVEGMQQCTTAACAILSLQTWQSVNYPLIQRV